MTNHDTQNREMTTEEFYAARDYGYEAARADRLRDDDNRDSFGDRVQPRAFDEALNDPQFDEIAAADISDAVWEGVDAGFQSLLEERY